ncbi:MAG: hypothetical protein AAF514_23065, partial [Verrucomicrobiota bacterium]
LDASAGMSWGNRFEEAVATLQREAEALPADRRRVYVSGAETRLVLDRSEASFLLGPRLDSREPDVAPSSLERTLEGLADEADRSGLEILVFGDAPVSETLLGRLPDQVNVRRVRDPEAGTLNDNAGISGIGVGPAASGAYDRVDVIVRLEGGVKPITAALEDEPLSTSPENDEAGRLWFRDLPANGGVLEVGLETEDALVADDVARITLPQRNVLNVSVADGVDERFARVVNLDPAFVLSTDPATAVVSIGGESGSRPGLELVPGNGIDVIVESSASRDAIAAGLASCGLERVGQEIGQTDEPRFRLQPVFTEGARRSFRIGTDLMGGDYDLVQSSAFPLLVSTALRWLAGVEEAVPYAIAGEALFEAGLLEAAGSPFRPREAGEIQTVDGRSLAVSLAGLAPGGSDGLETVGQAGVRRGWGLLTWVVLIVLGLLVLEWWFYQKGRMP